MHVLNFLVAILLPYITLFSKLAPPESVPLYFKNEEAAFLAGEFNVIIFYWAGFLRNYIHSRRFSEQKYFFVALSVLVFLCVSKIIFSLPNTWVVSMFAFGLGVLSVSRGQGVGMRTVIPMTIVSTLILSFTGFMLLGMAWYGFTEADYYQYRDTMYKYLIHIVK